jgi:hypothetical protein
MMRYLKSKYILYFGIAFALGTMLLISESRGGQEAQSPHPDPSPVKGTVTRPVDVSIRKDSKDIFQNEDALYSYVKKFGLKQTIARLSELEPLYGDCHQPAHKAGRFAYDIYSTEAFRSLGPECHSGSFHGTIEAYFKKHGTADLSAELKEICGSDLNPFFNHQCLHGIGHGLMAWSHYELFDALKACDVLGRGSTSCWTGVFMENVVGGLAGHGEHGGPKAHFTKYLNEDPQYPCSAVEDKYKSYCYSFQTSRMMQLFDGDFSKIAHACFQAPRRYHASCFASMGRDVEAVYRGNPAGAIQVCSIIPMGPARNRCFTGAVQDEFWDPNGQDTALNFCKLLKYKDQLDACYKTVFARGQDVLASKKDFRHFCSKAESRYQSVCLGFMRKE